MQKTCQDLGCIAFALPKFFGRAKEPLYFVVSCMECIMPGQTEKFAVHMEDVRLAIVLKNKAIVLPGIALGRSSVCTT